MSAVLAAQQAFALTVDGLLASLGELAPSAKWRARKLLRACPAALPWATWWEIQTMRSFDPDHPARWVERVVGLCQDLMLEVDFA